MRHFFTEKHKMPMSWFAMRLNYTRSVATTSIDGHILGLGDRHTSNILMDNGTGEAVHIDLGIAFEQVRFPNRVRGKLFHASPILRIIGEATAHSRMRSVSHDGRHGRWHGYGRDTRCFPALCGGDVAGAS